MSRIARIEAWCFRAPTPRPVATSFGIMHDRPAVLVRVEDHDGAFGWGEIWANWPAAGAEHRVRLLEMDLAPLILGGDAGDPAAFFQMLEEKSRIRAVQCGEIGPFAQVIAGIDIALWDLAARRAGMPLRQLIEPDARPSVPAYASGIQITAAHDLMPAARAAGHRRFKLKVGFDMKSDVALTRKIVEGLPAGERVACDANQAWTPGDAAAFVDAVADLPLHWLEEPLPVFAPEPEWRALAVRSPIPLAGGENVIGMDAFRAVVAHGHLGIVQPDVAKWGGISGCLAVARLALASGRRYFPHFLGAGLGLAASAELLAGVGGDGLLEVDVNANPLRSLFFDKGEPVSEGSWHCSDRPGLGIETLPEGLSPFQTLYREMS